MTLPPSPKPGSREVIDAVITCSYLKTTIRPVQYANEATVSDSPYTSAPTHARPIKVYALKFSFNDKFRDVVRRPGQKDADLSVVQLMGCGTLAGLFLATGEPASQPTSEPLFTIARN